MGINYWTGQLVRLRALEPSDWETHYEWDKDTEMYRPLDRIYFPVSREAARRRAEEALNQKPTSDDFPFEVENLAGEIVGAVHTDGCNRRTGTFSYGVAVRREHQGKGYASEALTLVLRYYFEELGYQKVNVQVHSYNQPSQRLHEKLGFVPEGRLRRVIYTEGRYFDLLLYGMTAEEFAEKHGKSKTLSEDDN